MDQKVLAQLPQELVTEILKLLLVKSLLRFRCVSKSFSSIIDGQDFNNSVMNRSAEDNRHLNLIFPTSNQVSTNYDSAKVHVSDFESVKGIEVSGYCNGVFLLLLDECRPALWNPSTRQLRVLPCIPFDPEALDYPYFGVGFGYDSSRDDYQVVAIAPGIAVYQVWAFGLRSNAWRQLSIDSQARADGYLGGFRFGCFARGDLHWLCANETDDQKIVAFDLAREMVSLLAAPNFNRLGLIDSNLHVTGDFLFVSFSSLTIENEARLYISKKDGAKLAWSLLYLVTEYQLPPFLVMCEFEYIRVLGYSEEGDKILLDLHLDRAVSYDIKEKRFQLTDITLSMRNSVSPARSFVESLVSLHATNRSVC